MRSLSDEELLASYRAAEGTPEARPLLDELFRRLLGPVLLNCCRITGDYEWAADLAQEVLLRVFRNLKSFRGDSKFSTWVYTIARNHCNRSVRSKAVGRVRMDEASLQSIAGTDDDPYTQLVKEAAAESLSALLRETLTASELQVVTLHYGDGVPLDEITRLLGLQNTSGAKAYIVRARRKLQSRAAAMQRLHEA